MRTALRSSRTHRPLVEVILFSKQVSVMYLRGMTAFLELIQSYEINRCVYNNRLYIDTPAQYKYGPSKTSVSFTITINIHIFIPYYKIPISLIQNG